MQLHPIVAAEIARQIGRDRRRAADEHRRARSATRHQQYAATTPGAPTPIGRPVPAPAMRETSPALARERGDRTAA